MGARKDLFRWGDAADDDEGGLDNVIGPDEKGIKIVIEYRRNDEGQKIKVTKRIRVKKQVKKLSPSVIRRRQLKKFGDAFGQGASENMTMVSTEEIFLERTNKQTGKQEEQKAPDLATLGNASLIICRICGKKGDHWTSKCPFKDLAASRGFTTGEKPPDENDMGSMSSAASKGGSSYVPPSMRAGGRSEGESMRMRGRDENSIRVTNLSEDTREADLQELFRGFGPISRIYVAFDRETGLSRGFAFINFINREDAQLAINKLDGYGYDNLILRVEWATPRADRPGGG
eukprot:SM000050S17066  [mRNA]  locus=s50:607912:609818:- [translate_table: standard]